MRIPVVSIENKPLMPTKPSRVRKWLKSGKAVKRWSKLNQFYVQLTVDPSDLETQDISIGIDPGKKFSGIGVQSQNFTLFMAHLVLSFDMVKKRMETRSMMRRTRRSRRIDRSIDFKIRNHRQERFSNRKGKKLPPSIRANRQLELRVVKELLKIYPVSSIVYELVKADVDRKSGRKKAKSGKGFSPVMVGQNWMIDQLSNLGIPVTTKFGYNTANIRRELGLEKSNNKKSQKPETHAVDGIALAATQFISYEKTFDYNSQGKIWKGSVNITDSIFSIIRRPNYSRRQLHLLQFAKGGKRRKYGGSTTRFGVRKGDFIRATQGKKTHYGYVSGSIENRISVSDHNWKRLGQCSPKKVELIYRSTGLVSLASKQPLMLTVN